MTRPKAGGPFQLPSRSETTCGCWWDVVVESGAPCLEMILCRDSCTGHMHASTELYIIVLLTLIESVLDNNPRYELRDIFGLQRGW